ncbi:histidine kinase [Sphingomonas sp. So64.6b]|uniref:sensor histidine kinase n=1 Tax=Sphingomonas sp. So64.6b TaxID=2997354 RepID=UPI001602E63E|nr:PAS domain-containing sensor histidine kinase [Sphingomonas sp. So64.6b]QNA84865.1 histidine kinase [Sphingomonas sp. So64.6b]
MPLSPPAIIDAANSMMLALISSSDAPLVLLDGDLVIIALSTSFCAAFDVERSAAVGRKLAALGNGEWNRPQLASLLEATVSGNVQIDAYEMDLARDGTTPRRLVLNAHTLDYSDDAANIRLVLTISDVTDARLTAKLKDELLHEKAVLLRELQHRVANSLQIIASVLTQSARRTSSAEARGHINDAHNRVMSIASLQQQLAQSQLGEVGLRSYFNDLCRSIGASMIHDHAQISLKVEVDDSITSADASVSLGLIVTELVINALKHAFPGTRHGVITVGYQSDGHSWTLSVRDDGVGMPVGESPAKPGLGTSIVEALAKQLRADVMVADADPGTYVSIVHPQSVASGIEARVRAA